jgi:hypothetical protein
MTDTVDGPPVADQIDALLTLLEDAWFDDTGWVDAEFTAIIAANWDTEPPDPCGPPTGLPNRWNPPCRNRRPGSRQRLADQMMANEHHGRQRSPPNE